MYYSDDDKDYFGNGLSNDGYGKEDVSDIMYQSGEEESFSSTDDREDLFLDDVFETEDESMCDDLYLDHDDDDDESYATNNGDDDLCSNCYLHFDEARLDEFQQYVSSFYFGDDCDCYCESDECLQDYRPSSPPLDFDIGYDDEENSLVPTTSSNYDVKSAIHEFAYEESVLRNQWARDSLCGAPSAIPAPVRESIVSHLSETDSVSFICFNSAQPFVDSKSSPNGFGLHHVYELGRDPPIATPVGDSRFGFG